MRKRGGVKKQNQISGLQKVLLVHSWMRITPQHGSVKAVVFEETRGVSPWSKTLVPRKPIEHAQNLGSSSTYPSANSWLEPSWLKPNESKKKKGEAGKGKEGEEDQARCAHAEMKKLRSPLSMYKNLGVSSTYQFTHASSLPGSNLICGGPTVHP